MAGENYWTELLGPATEDSFGAIAVDGDLSVRAISPGLLKRGGHRESELLGTSVLDLFHPVDIGRVAAFMAKTEPGVPLSGQGLFRLRTASGTWDIAEITFTRFGEGETLATVLDFSQAGDAVRAESLTDDTVELTQMLVEPVSLRSSFRDVADFAERNVDRLNLAITVFSEDGTSATFCHRDLDEETAELNAAAHPLSLPPHVVEAYSKARISPWRPDSDVGTIVPDRLDRVTMVLLDLEDNLLGYVDATRPTTVPPAEAEWRVYRLVLQILRTVMLRAQLDTRLEFLNRNDALTGLTNRRRLLELMSAAELEGSGIIVVNLDSFSWVNEELGFEAGDTVLTSVAASLSDFVPDRAVTARLSGDEFLVWLPTVETETEVFRLAERLRKVLMVPIDNADRRGRTRCSIGATRALPEETPDQAIHRVAKALVEAKSQGGDRVSHC